MASMVAKGCSTSNQLPVSMSVQEKGSRNKRKFRADPPLGDPDKILSSLQSDCPSFEFCAEKFDIIQSHGQSGACDVCGVSPEHSESLKHDLGLMSAVGSSEVGPSRIKEESDADEFHDADWNDLTEGELEELVLSNLETIFKSAIKKIVASGYAEDVALKAVLRSGLCYGCKDTVSNIVDNTLLYLKNGQEIDPSREHYFDDLQQLERYVLAELVCVLQEVRPFLSTGDAMWCLLMCDMNVSHACAMEGDPMNSFIGDGASNGESSVQSETPLKAEAESSEVTLPNPCKPIPSNHCSHGSQSETLSLAGAFNQTKQKNPLVNGQVSLKESSNLAIDTADKLFPVVKTSQHVAQEEKFSSIRKTHTGSSKREAILRQKSFHLEKNYRTYGSRGGRAGKLSGLGGLILDKKLKSVSESTSFTLKSGSLKIRGSMGVEFHQGSVNHNLSTNAGPSPPATFNVEPVKAITTIPKLDIPPMSPPVSTALALPAPALTAADRELSVSFSTEGNSNSLPVSCSLENPNCSYGGIPFDKSLGRRVPQDKKDEIILKMVPRIRELQNQLQEWTEWANQKVMQAARRLSKDKAELKTLRQEKDEVERLKKEKQLLEESTMKKLSEMENALCKASGQVDRANSAGRRLEVENAALRQGMEAAKLRAAESAASFQEVSKREKKTMMEFQSWDKRKNLFQEELSFEKRNVAQLQQELRQDKELQNQVEARWRQEEKAKEELLAEASSLRKGREEIEASAKSKENAIKSKAESTLQRYRDEVQRLEKEISQIRLKTDSSKIAALRRGLDGSYASKVTDARTAPGQKEPRNPNMSGPAKGFHEHSGNGGVKRERECVMCLSEEMSVVFMPCAHQVVCKNCNELHEKQGMKDCPSCRSPIQRRILVRYAEP